MLKGYCLETGEERRLQGTRGACQGYGLEMVGEERTLSLEMGEGLARYTRCMLRGYDLEKGGEERHLQGTRGACSGIAALKGVGKRSNGQSVGSSL